jgi:hypothetical protein
MAQFTVVRKLAVEVEWFFMITIHDPKMRVDSTTVASKGESFPAYHPPPIGTPLAGHCAIDPATAPGCMVAVGPVTSVTF